MDDLKSITLSLSCPNSARVLSGNCLRPNEPVAILLYSYHDNKGGRLLELHITRGVKECLLLVEFPEANQNQEECGKIQAKSKYT